MKKNCWVVFGALLSMVALVVGTQAGEKDTSLVLGKNPGKMKGRWLKVYDQRALSPYTTVFVGDIAVDMKWAKEGKETPIDEAMLKEKIKEHLLEDLKEMGVFQDVLETAPGEDRSGVVRLDCNLAVEPGSRATRYFIGMGAGKSKSLLEIHVKDHGTDQELGLYHGYGVGSGMGFKVGGGGARKMTQDDIQENSKMFAELMLEARQ